MLDKKCAILMDEFFPKHTAMDSIKFMEFFY